MLETVWEMGTLLHCWWEYKLVQPLWKTVWRFLKKLKIELLYNPAVLLLGKTTIQKHTCTPVFIALLFTIAKTWKQPESPSTDWWVKMWYIYTMEYYSLIKKWNNASAVFLSRKKEQNAVCRSMDASRDYHAKWSKSERERQIPHDITFMWNLKYGINEPIYKTETDSQTQRTDLWSPRREL